MVCPSGQVDVFANGYMCATPADALAIRDFINKLVHPGAATLTEADFPQWFPPAPAAPQEFDDSKLTFTGTWQHGVYAGAYQGQDAYSGEAGASATFGFHGSYFKVFGTKAAWHGSADVVVDGFPPVRFSAQATTRQEQVQLYARSGLPAGDHTVKLSVVGDGVISLDRVEADGPLVVVNPTPPPVPPPTPPPVPPGPVVSGPLQAIKVQGNKLVRADGSRFVPRGTNFYGVKAYPAGGNADSAMAGVNAWHQANADLVAGLCQTASVNFVRLLVAADGTTATGCKTIAAANAAHGIYTMLCCFSGGGGFDAAGGQAKGQFLVNLWSQLGKPAHVLLNLANEPNSISDAQWQQFSAAGVHAIRAGGYTAPIFLDTNGWAHANNAAQVKAIGDLQLVQCFHAYAFDGGCQGPGYATRMVQSWTSDQSVCGMTGEWGPFNGSLGGSQCNMSSALAEFCTEMRQEVAAAIKGGTLAGCLSWMALWDENSQLSGNNGGDWWDISSGAEKAVWNGWGAIAKAAWADCAAIAP